MKPAAVASKQELLRALPSVDEVVRLLNQRGLDPGIPRSRQLAAVREILSKRRREILEAPQETARRLLLDLEAIASDAAAELARAALLSPFPAPPPPRG